MPDPLKAVSIGAIILFLVVAVPVVVGSTTGVTTQTAQLEEGTSVSLSERLELTNERIRPPSPENATFTLRDNQTIETATRTVQNGTNATFALSGGNVTVTVTDVTDTDPETATAVVNTSTTYGWSPAEKTIASNLGMIVVVVAFIIVGGFTWSVVV